MPGLRSVPGRRGEEGSMAVFVAIAVLAILAVLGLVVDASGRLRTLVDAEGCAQEAARAGAETVNASQAISGRGIAIDPARAAAAARAYLRQAGVSGTVTVTSGTTLQVTVTAVYRPQLLLGLADTTVTGHGTATLITGG